MNVRMWFQKHGSDKWTRRLAAPVLALALAASFTHMIRETSSGKSRSYCSGSGCSGA